jgi:hypothetical protein
VPHHCRCCTWREDFGSLCRLGRSASGDDFDDLEAIARLEAALGEFGGCDSFAIVLNDNAAGKQILGGQELVECARKDALDPAVVGDDESRCH